MNWFKLLRMCKLYLSLIFLSLFFISSAQTDTSILRNHLTKITKTDEFRHFMNPKVLDEVAEYIFDQFKPYADSVYYQDFKVNGVRYRNVIAAFFTEKLETVVIGAHYDVCGLQEGADDNASGVCGLIEIARQIKSKNLDHRIELVAFTLEEPPFFRTENMGSYHHAKSLQEQGRKIYGMISLEMIGFFKDEKRTQDYPIGLMKLIYGNRGNYITVVNKFGKGQFGRKFNHKFDKLCKVRSKKFNGPKVLPGVDFSDHLNYWKFGYNALMITDTAFYRNKNYHQSSDKMETLDLVRMAGVIDGVIESLASLH